MYCPVGPGGASLSVAIVLGAGQTSGSVTIAQLTYGTYTVTEERAWSWRCSDAGSENVAVGESLAQVTFDHDLIKFDWLSGCSHRVFE